jgi:hypothetical protein
MNDFSSIAAATGIGAFTKDEGVSRSPTVRNSILETIGHTPVIRLRKLFTDTDVEVLAKLEALNPGGSIKDRPAYNMIMKAIASGRVTAETTIVESSSGNFAIGLAQICMSGRPVGKVNDLIARLGGEYPLVFGLRVRTPGRSNLDVSWSDVRAFESSQVFLNDTVDRLEPYELGDRDVLLARHVMDKQIVDLEDATTPTSPAPSGA